MCFGKQCVVDASNQFADDNWLVEEVVGAQFERLETDVRVFGSGQKYDRSRHDRLGFANFLNDFKSGNIRHANIHQDDIWLLCANPLNCFG